MAPSAAVPASLPAPPRPPRLPPLASAHSAPPPAGHAPHAPAAREGEEGARSGFRDAIGVVPRMHCNTRAATAASSALSTACCQPPAGRLSANCNCPAPPPKQTARQLCLLWPPMSPLPPPCRHTGATHQRLGVSVCNEVDVLQQLAGVQAAGLAQAVQLLEEAVCVLQVAHSAAVLFVLAGVPGGALAGQRAHSPLLQQAAGGAGRGKASIGSSSRQPGRLC